MGMTAEHGVIPALLPPLSLPSSQGAFTGSSQGASEREAPLRRATQIGTGSDCQLQAKIATLLENKRKRGEQRHKGGRGVACRGIKLV